jgi:hypothetical protein
MAKDDQPLNLKTTQEESMRQAEAAFGGAAPKQPDALPTGAPVATPTGVPGVRRRRFPVGRLFAALLPLIVIGGVAVGIYALVKNAADDATNPGSPISVPRIPGVPSIPSLPEVPSQPSRPAQPSAPSGSTSNFTIAGLTRSRTTARRLAGPGARIELARVSDDQLQVIARTGSRRKVVIVSGPITRAIDTPGGTLSGNELSFDAFSPAVLARILSGVKRSYHVSASSLDYVVLLRNPVTKDAQWLVYPRGGGAHFQADARGGSLRRVG